MSGEHPALPDWVWRAQPLEEGAGGWQPHCGPHPSLYTRLPPMARLEQLGFNALLQLMIGVPLEMVHGLLRISLLYLAGVLAGEAAACAGAARAGLALTALPLLTQAP